jgi:hypothetical protein
VPTEFKPETSRKKIGRPRSRWKYIKSLNVVKCEDVEWIKMATERLKLRAWP